MVRPVGSKYLLEEPLGRGASGTVWLGRVRDTDEPVAVKVLREELAADPDVVTRFIRERSLLLRVRHPHLVRVRDLVVEGELLALVMDLVDGPDLRVHLRGQGPTDPAQGAFLMAGVVGALAAAHATGIVHRDFKPGNILLAASADGAPHAMLTDFGIARLAEGPAITRTHEFLGTPAYLAPETALGLPPTPAVDLYAAGVVLCELVSGAPPFRDDNPLVVMRRHIEETPRRPDGMPEQLWSVAAACLAKDPSSRPTAEVLATRLGQLATTLGGGRPGAWPGAAWAPPARDATTTTLPAAGLAGATAPIRTGTAWQAQPSRREQLAPDSYFRPAGPIGSAGSGGPSGTRVFANPPTQVDPGAGGYPPQPPIPAGPTAPPADIVWPRREVVEPEPERYAPPPRPEPAPRRPPRQAPPPRQPRSRPHMRRIPGLGCLLRLVVLFVVGAVLWHMLGVSARIHQTAAWFQQLSDDVRAVRAWFSSVGSWFSNLGATLR